MILWPAHKIYEKEAKARDMKSIKNKKMVVGALAVLVYAAIFVYLRANPEEGRDGGMSASGAGRASLAAVAAAMTSMPKSLDQKSKTADCHINGSLPDHECSPGAVFENAKLTDICQDGYTKTVRNVPVSLKKKIYKAYGIPYPQPFGTYELDHLIPLTIGGSNDPANLFPEAKDPPPGFPDKDVVENYLHMEICSGNIDIKAAQAAIASDWTKIYQSLAPEDITSLRAQFKSWAE